MEVGLRGIGEYPGYYCYDATRPSWLPYWLDDWTESICKARPSTIIGNVASCLNPISADCSTPANPNPTVSGPGAGGPPLSAGNSTAGVEPIQSTDIPTAVGQAIGATVGGATSGIASGLSSGLGDFTIPLLLIGGVALILMLKR